MATFVSEASDGGETRSARGGTSSRRVFTVTRVVTSIARARVTSEWHACLLRRLGGGRLFASDASGFAVGFARGFAVSVSTLAPSFRRPPRDGELEALRRRRVLGRALEPPRVRARDVRVPPPSLLPPAVLLLRLRRLRRGGQRRGRRGAPRDGALRRPAVSRDRAHPPRALLSPRRRRRRRSPAAPHSLFRRWHALPRAPDLLARVLAALDHRFGVHPDAEISMEMDPGTFDGDAARRVRRPRREPREPRRAILRRRRPRLRGPRAYRRRIPRRHRRRPRVPGRASMEPRPHLRLARSHPQTLARVPPRDRRRATRPRLRVRPPGGGGNAVRAVVHAGRGSVTARGGRRRDVSRRAARCETPGTNITR